MFHRWIPPGQVILGASDAGNPISLALLFDREESLDLKKNGG
ncbi:MAG: hypothetical protein OXD54_06260 [Candidatus Poribacteria bacterium]|nr:hypothetical protein [Candidatus Poribacteria bacterium]